MEIHDIYMASQLQSMHQELTPFGLDPIDTYNKYLEFLDCLDTDKTTVSNDYNFEKQTNPPELKNANVGRLYVSMHIGTKFSCIPPFIMKNYSDKKIIFLMRKETRDSLPAWKNEVYLEAEKQGMEIIYAEDRNTAIHIARHLKNGGDVFTYIDAAFGTTDTVQTLEVPFLYHAIEAPKGIFKLGQIGAAELIPVCAIVEQADKYSLFFSRPIPLTTTSIEDAMRSCYRYFGMVILRSPSQWSQWGFMYDQSSQEYYHEMLGTKAMPKNSEVFDTDSGQYVFDYQKGYLKEIS